MALYLALDVGGTKTACALADEQQVLGRAVGGSIKTLRLGPQEARANLEAVLLDLVSSTGADLREIKRTCIGTSGASVPAVRAWMREAIRETVGSELILLGDEVIALDAAFPGARGVLAIAGTGSNVVGRAATGQMTHAGGWGPMLADAGSGHWIGHQALRACFDAIDARPPSSADWVAGSEIPLQMHPDAAAHFFSEPDLADLPPLLLRFLDHLALPGLDALIGAANAPEFRFAQLVPAVIDAARASDPLSAEVLVRAGQALALLVSHAIEKVAHLESHMAVRAPVPEVAFIGGVLTHIPEVRQAMLHSLDRRYPGIVLRPDPADALSGALWHARGRP